MPSDETWLDVWLPSGGDVAIDVGANRGAWATVLARRFTTVYAIEPNPALGDALRSLPENVELLQVGAWDKAEWREFAVYEQDVHLSAKFYNGGINSRQPVGTVRLWCQPIDEMPIDGKVGFIKVDVEAAEVEVIKGAERRIRRDRPELIIEVHMEENGLFLENALLAMGYRVRRIPHPYYRADEPLYRMHFWMVCEPA